MTQEKNKLYPLNPDKALVIKSKHIFLEDGQFHAGLLFIQNGKIEKISVEKQFNSSESFFSKQCEILDATDDYVIPGLIDSHFHGCNGADFSDASLPGLHTIAAYALQNGVTTICPATMTLPFSKIEECLITAQQFTPSDNEAGLAGIYLEGPFFCAEKKGAQNALHLQNPDLSLIQNIPLHLQGLIRVIALAPELPGADSFIEKMTQKFPIQISLGHTAATADKINAAFAAGARRITHLYNAMTHPEAMLLAASRYPNAYAELICDGIHNSPERIIHAFETLGDDKIVLISDSMRATGLGDGSYDLGMQNVTVSGKLALLSDGTKAGSVSTLLQCLQTAVSIGIPLSSAVKAVTCNPAKSLGLQNHAGFLKKNLPADITVLDSSLNLRYTIKGMV